MIYEGIGLRTVYRGEQLLTRNPAHDEAKVSHRVQMSSVKVRVIDALNTPSAHPYVAQSERDDISPIERSELSETHLPAGLYVAGFDHSGTPVFCNCIQIKSPFNHNLLQ